MSVDSSSSSSSSPPESKPDWLEERGHLEAAAESRGSSCSNLTRLRFMSSLRVAGADTDAVVLAVTLAAAAAAALADAGGGLVHSARVPPALPAALLVIGLQIADTYWILRYMYLSLLSYKIHDH